MSMTQEKTNQSIISIIGYGQMVENETQIKIDNITIIGNLFFQKEKPEQFYLFENERNSISFVKLEKPFYTKNGLIQLSLDEIFSILFFESKKMWESSIFSVLERENSSLNFYSKDENNKPCFITILISHLHKVTIKIRDFESMTDFILENNYLIKIENPLFQKN